MFTIDPTITALPLKEKKLSKALFSMNSHPVATPEMGLEEARSYVFFFHEGNNRLSAYIALHFLHTDRKLFYTHSANPFLEHEMPDVEDEARNFADGLGAMLDELDFSKMSDLEKDRWIEDQGIFIRKKQPEDALVEQPPQSEVAAAAPAVQPQPVSVPEPPAALVRPAPQSSQAELQEQPQSASVTGGVQPKAPPAAPKRRQEPVRKAIREGILKTPEQSPKKEAPSPTGVVSRDREALARLLTSF